MSADQLGLCSPQAGLKLPPFVALFAWQRSGHEGALKPFLGKRKLAVDFVHAEKVWANKGRWALSRPRAELLLLFKPNGKSRDVPSVKAFRVRFEDSSEFVIFSGLAGRELKPLLSASHQDSVRAASQIQGLRPEEFLLVGQNRLGLNNVSWRQELLGTRVW